MYVIDITCTSAHFSAPPSWRDRLPSVLLTHHFSSLTPIVLASVLVEHCSKCQSPYINIHRSRLQFDTTSHPRQPILKKSNRSASSKTQTHNVHRGVHAYTVYMSIHELLIMCIAHYTRGKKVNVDQRRSTDCKHIQTEKFKSVTQAEDRESRKIDSTGNRTQNQ